MVSLTSLDFGTYIMHFRNSLPSDGVKGVITKQSENGVMQFDFNNQGLLASDTSRWT
jgi:hypothetical protein